jgi:acid stress-induced BolA-like protein IbaG/YrbA
MKALPISTDKIAISLSTLCVIHCLSLPLLVALLPSFTVLSLHGEAFHFWMVVAVIPISLFALQMGCKKHKTVYSHVGDNWLSDAFARCTFW